MANNKEANDHVLIRDQRMLMKIEMMCEVIVKEIIEIIVTDEIIPTEIVIPFGEVIWDGEIDHKEVDI